MEKKKIGLIIGIILVMCIMPPFFKNYFKKGMRKGLTDDPSLKYLGCEYFNGPGNRILTKEEQEQRYKDCVDRIDGEK